MVAVGLNRALPKEFCMSAHQYIEEIRKNPKAFALLVPDRSAQPRYELLSDALIWRDEMPTSSFEWTDVLRFAWRYRIVRLRPEHQNTEPHLEMMKSIWDVMKTECSTWPGFLPERCEAVDILKQYESLKKQFERDHPLPNW